jgi:predicted phosphodiesterase
VNRLDEKPDFVVFTGDLTQTTDDPKVRRQRLAEFREQAAELKVPAVRFFAGEHDASLDRGEAYQEVIGGPLRYTFDHKGVHFIVLDNTSDPRRCSARRRSSGSRQTSRSARRTTRSWCSRTARCFRCCRSGTGRRATAWQRSTALLPYRNVVVFYGHIHHEHHHRTGHIEHHAARSLMFPLSPVGTAAQKTQLPWNPAQPSTDSGSAASTRARPVPRRACLSDPWPRHDPRFPEGACGSIVSRRGLRYHAAAAVPERIALRAAKFEFSATEIRVRKAVR